MRKITGRKRRHNRIKKKLFGTPERPRLAVYRSLKNIYAHLIDDIGQKMLMTISTNSSDLREKIGYGGNVKAAAKLGEFLAKKAKEKNITRVVFDRCGYKYHGRIKALAESAKKNGLLFGEKKQKDAKAVPQQ